VQVLGDPMAFWRTMPKRLLLRSNMSATNIIEPSGPLSMQSYRAAAGARSDYPIPLDTFTEYGLWVQRIAVPDLDQRLVSHLQPNSDGFDLTLRSPSASACTSPLSTRWVGHLHLSCPTAPSARSIA
jgi:FAD-dependent urate hydroxylase